MIVITFLDDRQGMLFHNRRLSRDRAASSRIKEICAGKKLWMNAYSARLYGTLDGVDIALEEAFLLRAGEGEFCLVETEMLKPVEERIEEIIVFWWNRVYPADICLDLDLSRWDQVSCREFKGNSHESITEIIYRRGDAK